MNEFYTPPLKPDEILHYGMPRRSGRYPWGSGDRPYQRDTAFNINVDDVKIKKECFF